MVEEFRIGPHGIEHKRSNLSYYNISGADLQWDESDELFRSDIETGYKSFDIHIEYDFDNFLSPGESHIITVTNDNINGGDNIVVNMVSSYTRVSVFLYGIEDGVCLIDLINNSEINIPPNLTEGATETGIVTLTITIIT
tara:strand:- start:326 stop:745 length:420 start_codon:yes stop_codon:yes gene_type:complete